VDCSIRTVLHGIKYPLMRRLSRNQSDAQESRRFGRVIAERAKSGAPELSSGVVSYSAYFRVTGSCGRSALAEERHCVSSDSR